MGMPIPPIGTPIPMFIPMPMPIAPMGIIPMGIMGDPIPMAPIPMPIMPMPISIPRPRPRPIISPLRRIKPSDRCLFASASTGLANVTSNTFSGSETRYHGVLLTRIKGRGPTSEAVTMSLFDSIQCTLSFSKVYKSKVIASLVHSPS